MKGTCSSAKIFLAPKDCCYFTETERVCRLSMDQIGYDEIRVPGIWECTLHTQRHRFTLKAKRKHLFDEDLRNGLRDATTRDALSGLFKQKLPKRGANKGKVQDSSHKVYLIEPTGDHQTFNVKIGKFERVEEERDEEEVNSVSNSVGDEDDGKGTKRDGEHDERLDEDERQRAEDDLFKKIKKFK